MGGAWGTGARVLLRVLLITQIKDSVIVED
jgi:hypothetical protein